MRQLPRYSLFPAIADLILFACLILTAGFVHAQGEGLLRKDGQPLFPIGFYELPESADGLNAMAQAGVNVVHCRKASDLDRAQKARIMGWISLPVHQGPTEALRERIEAVKDHPALAVWEGPDEIVWNFTAYSGLFKKLKVHKTPGEWWRQTPEAVEYAERKAAEIIPNIRDGIKLVRELDSRNRQFWINEALNSDTKYVRQYLDWIDITGCDLYPVKDDNRPIIRMAGAVERWKQVGKGKPVWMVLQAFSWNELGDYYGETVAAYPTFHESRFMAYDVIAHGAKGILYWGSHYLKSDEFRQSLYALTSELAALQPFLVQSNQKNLNVTVIESDYPRNYLGVRAFARRTGREWLIVLVNEDDERHAGVEVSGLNSLDGHRLELLYGEESVTVREGEFVTRMQPYEVKVFATGREWESDRRAGREYE